MKSIITIALMGTYPSASPPDDLVRGLRAEMEAHARAYGLNEIEVAVNTWKSGDSLNFPPFEWQSSEVHS